jgi:uncharacterized protein (TIGR02118 family)
MVKLVVAYRHPTDVEEFERRYKHEHVAMARRIPHMSRIEFAKVVGMMDGSKAPYHRIAELYFSNQAAMGQGASSPRRPGCCQTCRRHSVGRSRRDGSRGRRVVPE